MYTSRELLTLDGIPEMAMTTPVCMYLHFARWVFFSRIMACISISGTHAEASPLENGTKIPTIIDPSAAINYPSATGSKIVRISITTMPFYISLHMLVFFFHILYVFFKMGTDPKALPLYNSLEIAII